MEAVGPGVGLATEVEVVEELGADAYIYGSTDVAGERRSVITGVDGPIPPAKGDILHLAPRPGHLHLFTDETGVRLVGQQD